jgi:hypothetical protein
VAEIFFAVNFKADKIGELKDRRARLLGMPLPSQENGTNRVGEVRSVR